MNVRSLHLRNVLSHRDTRVRIPDRGVVLVTGPNGAGKSSLIEAVAAGVWGRTLRGTSPWNGDEGSITVETPEMVATRSRSSGKSSLAWSRAQETPRIFETTTKAQEALEDVIGSMDTWRRSNVFSAQDAASFTGATDAERKRLLETLLGIEFDAALETCRRDVRAAESVQIKAESEVGKVKAALAAHEARLRDADEMLGKCGEVPAAPSPEEIAEMQQAAESARAALSRHRKGHGNLEIAWSDARAQLRVTQQRLDAVSRDQCPTCLQVVRDATRESFASAVHRAKVEEETAKRAVAVSTRDLQEETDEVALLDRRIVEARTQASRADAVRTLRQQAERTRAMAADVVAEARGTLAGAQEGFAAAAKELGILKACEVVLGVRGVRAQILSRLLGAVEQVANLWIARIAKPGLRLSLKPHQERKTGGVVDAISLEIEGAGGGYGYRGASGGERRRIDVAILIALSEIAAGIRGSRGTLWCDEVFDTLDPDGVDALVGALQELATDRAVVVISHADNLVDRLQPALHLRIAAGTVRG